MRNIHNIELELDTNDVSFHVSFHGVRSAGLTRHHFMVSESG